MSLYIVRAALEINGTEITDFKAVTQKSTTIRKSVHLMYKTGTASLTQRFELEVDYVVPADKAEFAFPTLQGGTFTVEYDNGTRVNYGGVSTLTTGDSAVDGENELVRKVTLMAETKDGNAGDLTE